jgi:IS30 family transposase
MAQRYKHLSYEQRLKIKTMLNSGFSSTAIAEALGVHKSSICREITRGTVNGTYDPDYSEKRYRQHLAECGVEPIIASAPALSSYIAELILKDKLSPEKIVAVLNATDRGFKKISSCRTIYNAIDKGLIPGVTRESLRSEETTVYHNCVFLSEWVRDALDIKDGDTMHFEVTEDKKIIFSKVENRK